MKKTKFHHRLMALVLAVCFLLGGALTVNAATDSNGSVTDKVLADIKEQLNAISYEEYCANNALYPDATQEIVLDVLNYDKENSEVTGDTIRVVTAGGEVGLYTPATGIVSWKTNQVLTPAMYSIVIEYWPDQAKAASIERILKINGSIPFAEARFITLPKVWKNVYTRAQVIDLEGKVSVQSL